MSFILFCLLYEKCINISWFDFNEDSVIINVAVDASKHMDISHILRCMSNAKAESMKKKKGDTRRNNCCFCFCPLSLAVLILSFFSVFDN